MQQCLTYCVCKSLLRVVSTRVRGYDMQYHLPKQRSEIDLAEMLCAGSTRLSGAQAAL